MASNNPQNRARQGGSGFTVFTWDSGSGSPHLIAFAQQIAAVSPTPVAPPTPIHPLDTAYATEILTPAAANPGTITLELIELYGEKVWERLAGLASTTDIVDIFIKVAQLAKPIQLVKVVTPPKLGGRQTPQYTEIYHNCIISNVLDNETIEVGTMQVLKQIEVMYTQVTRPNVKSQAVALQKKRPS